MERGAALRPSSSRCGACGVHCLLAVPGSARPTQCRPSSGFSTLARLPSNGSSAGALGCRVSVEDARASAAADARRSAVKGFPDLELSSMTAVSPLDGRYEQMVKDLRPFFSEYGLIRYRVMVEVQWLLKLSEIPEIAEVPSFSKDARTYLDQIVYGFDVNDALDVKSIEKVTNHDVKAVEYFLKKKCQCHPEISKVLEYFHFACTSEDINNLAHALALKEALNNVLFPIMVELCKAIYDMAKENASIPMLSRTHGQTASPTTLGKEMLIFAHRLSEQGKEFPKIRILGKFAGAVGNYNAHMAAYPHINWANVAEEFVGSLGISFNPYVTQIEPHDYIARLFEAFILFNNILVDFDRDIWSYVSLGYFKQIVKAGEIGSSTMPHKVNPIDFENSEGNVCMANAVLSGISGKLVISRLQRDLTDSTVLRNLGVGLGYSLLAYKSALRGIRKLQNRIGWCDPDLDWPVLHSMIGSATHLPLRDINGLFSIVERTYVVNEARLQEDLERSWEVLAEPIQTVMRRYDIPEPYEKLKELTRGRAVTKESIRNFVEGLKLPAEAKSSLLNLTPHGYIGAAEALVKSVDHDVNLLDGFKIL